MTPLMQGNGRYQHPRLSPDGRQVAVGIAGDNIDIWLYDIERNSPTRLTEEGTNYYPVWTPDGTSVTFASDRSAAHMTCMGRLLMAAVTRRCCLRSPPC